MVLIRQNSGTGRIFFRFVSSLDGFTPQPGFTPTLGISVNGAAVVTMGGTVTDLGDGVYVYQPTVGETTNPGVLQLFKLTTSGVILLDGSAQVVAFDPDDTQRLGLTALPAANIGSAGSLVTWGTGLAQLALDGGRVLISPGTGLGQLDVTAGVVRSNVQTLDGNPMSFTAGRLDVNLITATAGSISAGTLASDVGPAIFQTSTLTEDYAGLAGPATAGQLLHMIYASLAQVEVSGTTLTALSLDGATTAMTFALNSPTAPTSRVRDS